MVNPLRKRTGPAKLVAELRARGRRRKRRDPAGRKRLQAVIGAVDACFPSGANCYRRALIEIAVDAGAATEPLRMGLRRQGGPGSGHAWLGAQADGEAYDAEFRM